MEGETSSSTSERREKSRADRADSPSQQETTENPPEQGSGGEDSRTMSDSEREAAYADTAEKKNENPDSAREQPQESSRWGDEPEHETARDGRTESGQRLSEEERHAAYEDLEQSRSADRSSDERTDSREQPEDREKKDRPDESTNKPSSLGGDSSANDARREDREVTEATPGRDGKRTDSSETKPEPEQNGPGDRPAAQNNDEVPEHPEKPVEASADPHPSSMRFELKATINEKSDSRDGEKSPDSRGEPADSFQPRSEAEVERHRAEQEKATRKEESASEDERTQTESAAQTERETKRQAADPSSSEEQRRRGNPEAQDREPTEVRSDSLPEKSPKSGGEENPEDQKREDRQREVERRARDEPERQEELNAANRPAVSEQERPMRAVDTTTDGPAVESFQGHFEPSSQRQESAEKAAPDGSSEILQSRFETPRDFAPDTVRPDQDPFATNPADRPSLPSDVQPPVQPEAVSTRPEQFAREFAEARPDELSQTRSETADQAAVPGGVQPGAQIAGNAPPPTSEATARDVGDHEPKEPWLRTLKQDLREFNDAINRVPGLSEFLQSGAAMTRQYADELKKEFDMTKPHTGLKYIWAAIENEPEALGKFAKAGLDEAKALLASHAARDALRKSGEEAAKNIGRTFEEALHPHVPEPPHMRSPHPEGIEPPPLTGGGRAESVAPMADAGGAPRRPGGDGLARPEAQPPNRTPNAFEAQATGPRELKPEHIPAETTVRELHANLRKLEDEYQDRFLKLSNRHSEVEERVIALRAAYQTETDPAKRLVLENEARALKAEYSASMKEVLQLEKRRLELARNLVEVPAPFRTTAQLQDAAALGYPNASEMNEGMEILRRYTSKEVSLPQTIELRLAADERASADVAGKFVCMHVTDRSLLTIPHEGGHLLESNNPELLQASVNFLAERTADQTPVKLLDLHPGHSYGPDEVCLRDNLGKFRDDYVGRIYKDGNGKIYATEVLSKGIEYLHLDPIKFAREDPHYFDHVMKCLRGFHKI